MKPVSDAVLKVMIRDLDAMVNFYNLRGKWTKAVQVPAELARAVHDRGHQAFNIDGVWPDCSMTYRNHPLKWKTKETSS